MNTQESINRIVYSNIDSSINNVFEKCRLDSSINLNLSIFPEEYVSWESYSYLRKTMVKCELSNESSDTISYLSWSTGPLSNISYNKDSFLVKGIGVVEAKQSFLKIISVPPKNKIAFDIELRNYKGKKRDSIKIEYLFFPIDNDCDIPEEKNLMKDFMALRESKNMLSAKSAIVKKSDCSKYLEDSLHLVSKRLRKQKRIRFEISAKEELIPQKQEFGTKSFPIEVSGSLINFSNDTVFYLSNFCTPHKSQIEFNQSEFEKRSAGCVGGYWAELFKILPNEKSDFTMNFRREGKQEQIKLGYDLFEVPADFDLSCIKLLNIKYRKRPDNHKNLLWAETLIESK